MHTRYCKHRKPIAGRGSAYQECTDCGRQGPISLLVSTPCEAREPGSYKEILEGVSKALGMPVELLELDPPSDPDSPFAVALGALETPVSPFGE